MAFVWTTPCAEPWFFQRHGILVTTAELAHCTECEFCGSCATHGPRCRDLDHIEHFLKFASPGEPECGEIGGPNWLIERGDPLWVCQCVAGHQGKHGRRRGGWWPL